MRRDVFSRCYSFSCHFCRRKPPAPATPPEKFVQAEKTESPIKAYKAPLPSEPQLPSNNNDTSIKAESPENALPKAVLPPGVVAPEDKTAAVSNKIAPAPAEPNVYAVLLAFFSSRAKADKAWDSFVSKHPAQLGNLYPLVSSYKASDGKTYFRLQAGPFANQQMAADRCNQLKNVKVGCKVTAYSSTVDPETLQ